MRRGVDLSLLSDIALFSFRVSLLRRTGGSLSVGTSLISLLVESMLKIGAGVFDTRAVCAARLTSSSLSEWLSYSLII